MYNIFKLYFEDRIDLQFAVIAGFQAVIWLCVIILILSRVMT
jgi:hypothetical protein